MGSPLSADPGRILCSQPVVNGGQRPGRLQKDQTSQLANAWTHTAKKPFAMYDLNVPFDNNLVESLA